MVAKSAALIVQPDMYVQQKWKDCGAYAVKAVLNLYGVDKDLPPRKYLSSLGKIFFGFMFPNTIKRILRRKKFTANLLRAKKEKDKLLVLKKHIENNRPIITLITNIYTPMRKVKLLKKFYMAHWVTILGYDDKKRLLYIYDSLTHASKYEKDIPVGNVSIHYDDFLRFWRGRSIFRLVSYLYIPVIKKE